MNAAPHPRALGLQQPMLVVDPSAGAVVDATVGDLVRVLGPGDVVVVNDAATLPACLPAIAPSGRPHELRLCEWIGGQRWRAVAMGPGDWRDDTDRRPAPDVLHPGDRLAIGEGSARVHRIDPASPRLVVVDLFPPLQRDPLSWLYDVGRPIQYSYLDREVALHEVQAPFASRPWAMEMPSAGRPLQWSLVIALRRAGVEVHRLTHAAGISATGDPDLDARLPLPERYEIPARTAAAVARARRVLAVGTSVVRALEGSFAARGFVAPGRAYTSLRLGPHFVPRVVTGLLSGVHAPGTSHHAVLEAFADPDTLALADRRALEGGYSIHEFGDSTLVLSGSGAALRSLAA